MDGHLPLLPLTAYTHQLTLLYPKALHKTGFVCLLVVTAGSHIGVCAHCVAIVKQFAILSSRTRRPSVCRFAVFGPSLSLSWKGTSAPWPSLRLTEYRPAIIYPQQAGYVASNAMLPFPLGVRLSQSPEGSFPDMTSSCLHGDE
ncbi:hypothetical protein DM02DRAFT_88700 [Periconia macrospinosa]|uniref:Uncharacterized protein n=1 Tax=Periconia macrospinosa TaxID=97972 RepID=A0A2V1DJ17_9PLEO|nr:hypothetical protein DM02DRAFT_88700 [Periconia macrospinosa]